jgi:hypothetical protein
MNGVSPLRRLVGRSIGIVRRPGLRRRISSRIGRSFMLYTSHRRLRRALETTPPIALEPDTPVVIQTMVDHELLPMAVGALKSFLRFFPTKYAVLIHDGGGLSHADANFVARHLPGAHVVPADEAAATMDSELRRRGLPRCAAWRSQSLFARKIIDMVHYAAGRVTFYIDSDVLCHAYPHELLESLVASPFVERFNEDTHTFYGYSLTLEELAGALGGPVIPHFNAGLVVFQRDPDVSWQRYEQWLSLPHADPYLIEQTMSALDATLNRGEPLSPWYDAAARHARRGQPILTQHYLQLRDPHLSFDFARHVAPELRGEKPRAETLSLGVRIRGAEATR